MKRLIFAICALCVVLSVSAQRYDFDDIYFNPKKDIKRESTDNRVQITDDRPLRSSTTSPNLGEELDGTSDNSQLSTPGSQLSYTDRIMLFHRADGDTTQDRLAHIADTNYVTNVFVLTDGQYVVDVDGTSVEISENDNYPYLDWSDNYWNYPYYGPYYTSSYYWNRSLYGWYGGYYGGYYGWSVGYYDPYFYGFYNPWYDPFYSPYWGYAGCYDPYWGHHHHHHHHHGYYPHHGHHCHHGHHGDVHKPHHPKPDWGDYVARGGDENERRRVNSSARMATNVSSSRGVATSTPGAVRRASVERTASTSVVRGASTSTNRETSTVRGTSTSTNRRTTASTTSTATTHRRPTSTALPARPTTVRTTTTSVTSTPSTTTSTRSSSSVTRTTSSTTRSTSTVRSSSSSTRSTSTVRSTSSFGGSSRGGFGGSSSGGRSGGSSNSSRRR